MRQEPEQISTARTKSDRRQPRSVAFGFVLAGVLYLLLGGLGAVTDTWRWDESFSWHVVNLPLGPMWDKITGDVHPPLYYWLLAAWIKLLPSPQAMKLFSLLAGLLALLAAAMAGLIMNGARAGVLAALLWATFPQFLHFSQDARMYSLALFWEAMALLGWAVAFRRAISGWFIVVFALSCALYTHNLCLFFAAGLLGGEAMRLLMRRVRGLPPEAMSWLWLATASAAIGLLYLPWVPVLNHQRQFGQLLEVFSAPHMDSALWRLLHYAYGLERIGYRPLAALVPATIMLCALPLIWLFCHRPAASKIVPLPPGWMPILLGAGSLSLALIYSKYYQPVLAIERHSVLFLPFLLIPTAAGLARIGSRPNLGVLPLFAVAMAGGFAVFTLAKPRDPDRTMLIRAVFEHAPVDLPILTNPVTFPEGRLEWEPLSVLTVGQLDGLEAITDCTLVVGPSYGAAREPMINSVRMVIEQAKEVAEIYRSRTGSAYVLHGLPRGTLAALVGRTKKTSRTKFIETMGDFEPELFWSGKDLARLCQPTALVPLDANPSVRLMAERTRLPLSYPRRKGIYALAVGAQILGPHEKASSSTRYGNRPPFIGSTKNLLAVELIDASRPLDYFEFRIPCELAALNRAPTGDLPDGYYLDWGACIGLKPEWFNKKGWDGSCFRIGVSYDAMFAHAGFHEREGSAGSACRWTERNFEIELPVWPDTHPKELALWCKVPSQVKSRKLQVRIMPLDSDDKTPAAVAETNIPGGKFGRYLLSLSTPLEPGLYRCEFSLDDDFVPSEHGASRDSRHLGLQVNAIGLR